MPELNSVSNSGRRSAAKRTYARVIAASRCSGVSVSTASASSIEVKTFKARTATAARRSSRSAKCRYGAAAETPTRRLASASENPRTPRSAISSIGASTRAALRSPWWERPPLPGRSDGVGNTCQPFRLLPEAALGGWVVGARARLDPHRVAGVAAAGGAVKFASARGAVGRGSERRQGSHLHALHEPGVDQAEARTEECSFQARASPVQVGEDDAGVAGERDRLRAGCFEAGVQLVGEQQVRR